MSTADEPGSPTAPLQDRIDAYWNRRAPAYDAYQQRPERRELDRQAWSRVWSRALPDARARVLDVGCGSGHVALLLADLGHDVIGVDSSHRMLEIAVERATRQRSRAVFHHGDAHDPDLGPGTLDAVVGRYVMWTLRDPVAAVRRWARLLHPGGVVAMVDARWTSDGLGDLYGERTAALPLADAQSIEETADVFRTAGLREVTVEPLTEIHALDEAYGVAPGHELVEQHLVSGRAA